MIWAERWLLLNPWSLPHRHVLRRHVWVPLAQTIMAVSHFRDLGAQLTATHRVSTAQSKVRLDASLKALHRINRLPHDAGRQSHVAIACANKKALYSCEACHVDESHSRKYTACMSQLVSSHSFLHCGTLAFAFSKAGFKIDPYIEIFVLRIAMLRRIVIKYPHCLTTIRCLARLYRAKGLHGSFVAGDDLSTMTVSPPPGHPERHLWRDKQQPKGPVGLAMQHTYMLGAALTLRR